MSDMVNITIDGVKIEAEAGQTIMEAADCAGIYILRLCYHPDVTPHGSCRICTVKINGRFTAACTTPVEDGMEIVNEGDEELTDLRKSVVEMLFVEGNHYCMFCEMSGMCELQAVAYRLGILVPRHTYQFAQRDVDASHPDVYFDHNRCIQCGRCVQVSRDIDGKHVFELTERSGKTRISFDSDNGLAGTDLKVGDRSIGVCPVGAILVKNSAFRTPYGERTYDKKPIGSKD